MSYIKKPDARHYARFEYIQNAVLYCEDKSHTYSGTLIDVGLGGVQIEAKQPLPVNKKLLLVIERKEGGPLLKIHGKATYSTPTHGAAGHMSGFKFLPESHQDRIAIAEFVHHVFNSDE